MDWRRLWPFARRDDPRPHRPNRPFMAAAQSRLTASWLATERSINDELLSDLDALRARSRDMAKNNDYARRYLRMVARNIVGPAGFTLQCRVTDGPGKPDTLANSAIEAAWWRWCQRGTCEVSGRMSFIDFTRAVITACARDGEALVRVVGGTRTPPEPLRLQHIDVGRIDTQRNQRATATTPAIVMGVEQDQYGRPLAYWLKDDVDRHGGSTRHGADKLIHLYLPEHASQSRGLPWMHAAMLAMHDLGEFNRSAMLSARRGADVLGFIVSPDGTTQGMADESDADGEALKISAPGTYDVLPEGYDIRTPEYAYPNTVYGEFVKAILQRIASGLDVSYVALANDLEGVNYSSIRAGVLEERDQWQALQDWFIGALLEPVYALWLRWALIDGRIALPNGAKLPENKWEKFAPHEWQGRRWSWVDPLKDIQAAREAIRSGLQSPQQIAAQYGLDVEDVLDSISTFEQMLKDKGVTLVDYGTTSPAAPKDVSSNVP